MSEYIRLPDAEFEIMQIIWSQPAPISSVQVAALAAPQKNWKHQTVLTLLTRLTQREFLSSDKHGKERFYIPLITQEDYLSMETGLFMKKFHKNSITGLMSALYSGKEPNEEELSELEQWLKERS